MKSKISDKILNPIVLVLYIGALIAVTIFHEPWFDEAQAYLIARDASVLDIIFRIPHYEGHPFLWHLYLVPFAKSSLPFEIGIKSAAILINAIAMGLFIFKAPFKKIIRYTIPFTYYFFFLYGVVARCYSFTLLGFVLLAMAYKNRNTKPLLYVLFLMLLCLSSAYGIVFAGGIAIVWVIEILQEKGIIKAVKSIFSDKRIIYLAALFVFAVFLIYLIRPKEDTIGMYYPKAQSIFSRLFYMIILAPTEAVFMQHLPGNYHVSHVDIRTYIGALGVLVFALYALVMYVLARSKGKLKEMIIPYAVFAVFSAIMYFTEHHIPNIAYFTLFILWICFADTSPIKVPKWLTKGSSNPEKSQKSFISLMKIFMAVCIAVPLYWNISVIINDIKYPYDSKREIAEYIKQNNLEDAKIMAKYIPLIDDEGNIFICPNIQHDATVNAYFDDNIIYSLNGGSVGYVQHFLANDEYVDATIEKWRAIGAPDILIGEVDLNYIFEGSVTMDDYTRVLYAHQQRFVKNDSPKSWGAVAVYVRNDLVEEFGLEGIENPAQQNEANAVEQSDGTTEKNKDPTLSLCLSQPKDIEQVIDESYFILRCKMLSVDSEK